MKKFTMVLAVVGLILAGSTGTSADVFNAPGFTYTKIVDAGSDVLRAPAFSPDGTKVVYTTQDAANVRSVKLYDRTTGVTTTLDSWTGGGSDDGKLFQTSPYFSNDGTKIGWTVSRAPTDYAAVYDLSTSTLAQYGTVPGSGSDMGNSDFLGDGNSADQWVAWEYGTGGSVADIFLYTLVNGQYVQSANLTNTADYKEYEPDSNKAGDKILYWSGETAAEPVDTAHTLTNVGGTWIKDDGFNPIVGCTWAFWSEDETKIGVSKYDTGSGYGKSDLYVYDSNGNFLFDLTGDAVGQGTDWQFFGFNFNVGDEYLFCSTAGNTSGGRDIWLARQIPEPASIIVWGLLAAGCASGTLARRRNRRASWSDETRNDIHNVIDRARTNV